MNCNSSLIQNVIIMNYKIKFFVVVETHTQNMKNDFMSILNSLQLL